MNIEKHIVQACCGKKSTIYKLDRPIDKGLISAFIKIGFVEQAHFTIAGILYVENSDFIITGPIGSNRLQVKCRKADCDIKLPNLEIQLKQLV
jgi:hypothetical protein